jgi:hypothetical protein
MQLEKIQGEVWGDKVAIQLVAIWKFAHRKKRSTAISPWSIDKNTRTRVRLFHHPQHHPPRLLKQEISLPGGGAG